MNKLAKVSLFLVCGLSLTGCARPGEIGWTPAYTTTERGQMIARNWDMEGKQTQDDLDSLLMLRPMSKMTIWHIR